MNETGNNILVMKVNGEDWNMDMGEFDGDCLARCKTAHPNARGNFVGANDEICRCLLDEIMNTCSEKLGPPDMDCDPNKCKSRCASRHPNVKTNGYCFELPWPVGYVCACDYDC